MRVDPACSTVEAAKRIGEELVKVCIDLNINEISSYDRNGFVRGAMMDAFEIAISCHGFFTTRKMTSDNTHQTTLDQKSVAQKFYTTVF
ncbi:hypothetical protein AgCh_003605 [Apium graveolens]